MLSERMLGFFEGYIDGEGCLSVDLANKGRTGLWRLRINSTDHEIIKMFHTSFGGSLYFPKRIKTNHKLISSWVIFGENASDCLKQLQLLGKGEQQKVWLHSYEEYKLCQDKEVKQAIAVKAKKQLQLLKKELPALQQLAVYTPTGLGVTLRESF